MKGTPKGTQDFLGCFLSCGSGKKNQVFYSRKMNCKTTLSSSLPTTGRGKTPHMQVLCLLRPDHAFHHQGSAARGSGEIAALLSCLQGKQNRFSSTFPNASVHVLMNRVHRRVCPFLEVKRNSRFSSWFWFGVATYYHCEILTDPPFK